MEDLADYIKRHYFGIPKNLENCVKERVVKMNVQRKNERHDKAFGNRNIPENISPYVTPREKRSKPTEKPEPKPEPVNKRFEMLQKWKADKEKKKQMEKKKEKPLFKVCHVPVVIGLSNLENVNCEIKGKKFKSKFAPANHEFKPPSNIKPIDFQYTKTIKEKPKNDTAKHQMMTRSQARKVCPVNHKSKNPTKTTTRIRQTKTTETQGVSKKTDGSKKAAKSKETAVTKGTQNEEIKVTAPLEKTHDNSLLSPDYPVVNDIQSDESDGHKTPKKSPPPPTYISPFVTISRGKSSARKEYESRKLGTFKEKSDTANCTSPRAGAAYFSWLLNNHVSRLQELCELWNKYKEQESLPEEAHSMIDVAIGQTNLLLTKKFMQFQGLIDACNKGNGDKPVTCEDLHGFWDMIHLQIENLNKRFDNLNSLKANNWEEVLPEVRKVVSKKTKVVKNVKSSAGLRAAIEAARRKKNSQDGSNEISIQTKTPQNRRSSRLILVKTDEKKRRQSSPGLMMMKVSQLAKSVDTPAKSILKTDVHKSAKSQSKVVIFRDEIEKADENLENDANIINSPNKAKTPQRRSTRLSKAKLF